MPRREPIHIPDGLYAVPDPDDPHRITYWSVQASQVRDYPPDVRWRPLPPTPPEATTDRAERRAFTQRWYETHYFPWRAAAAAAILADPDAAAARFRAAYPDATLPPLPAHRRRGRPGRPPTRRPRTPSLANQRLATERLAVRALAQLGYTYRRIGEELNLSLATVHRRMHAGVAPEASTLALLAKARDVETALLAGRLLHPDRVEQIDQWLADVRVLADRLAEHHQRGRVNGQ